MQPAFLWLLGFFGLLAIACFCFSVIYRRNQVIFLLLMGLIIPLNVAVLTLQSGAIARLEELSIPPPPEYRHAIGLQAGQAGLWVLRSQASASAVLNFYRQADYDNGWRIAEIGALSIRLRRPNQQILIAASTARAATTVAIRIENPG